MTVRNILLPSDKRFISLILDFGGSSLAIDKYHGVRFALYFNKQITKALTSDDT